MCFCYFYCTTLRENLRKKFLYRVLCNQFPPTWLNVLLWWWNVWLHLLEAATNQNQGEMNIIFRLTPVRPLVWVWGYFTIPSQFFFSLWLLCILLTVLKIYIIIFYMEIGQIELLYFNHLVSKSMRNCLKKVSCLFIGIVIMLYISS